MWHSGPNLLAEAQSGDGLVAAAPLTGKDNQATLSEPASNRAQDLGFCQIPACRSMLHTGNTRPSYARYKLCMKCITADFVLYKEAASRWCQKCSRFQLLQDFEARALP